VVIPLTPRHLQEKSISCRAKTDEIGQEDLSPYLVKCLAIMKILLTCALL